jgi:DNA polymerase III delta subunit
LLRGLLDQGEPALRLLAMIAREVRLLLIARECLDTSLRGAFRADLSYPNFQSRVLPRVDEETQMAFGKAHPFVLYKRFQDASRLQAAALRRALQRLADIDRRLKSTRTDAALLLESFVIDWCRPQAARHS